MRTAVYSVISRQLPQSERPTLPSMPIDPKLLDILCCPISKQPVFPLSEEKLAAVNAAIATGQVTQANNTVVATPLGEGLITKNKQRIYRIDDGIPVMLEEESIAVEQIDGL